MDRTGTIMALETYVISLEDVTQPEIEQILRTLNRANGKVNMIAKKCIIATFDNAYVDTVRKQRGVKLVGGVNFKGRQIRKIIRKSHSRE